MLITNAHEPNFSVVQMSKKTVAVLYMNRGYFKLMNDVIISKRAKIDYSHITTFTTITENMFCYSNWYKMEYLY